MIAFEPTEDQTHDAATASLSSRSPPSLRAYASSSASAASRRTCGAWPTRWGSGSSRCPRPAAGRGSGSRARRWSRKSSARADAAAAFGLARAACVRGGGGRARHRRRRPRRSSPPSRSGDGHARFGAVAWSEAAPNKERAGFTTVATREGGGWKLTGKKAFVVNAALAPIASSCSRRSSPRRAGAASARSSSRSDNPGCKVGARHDTLGLDAASFGELDARRRDRRGRRRASPRRTTRATTPSPRATAALLREARARRRRARGRASRASPARSRASTARRARRSASRSATFRRSPSPSPIARMDVECARWLVWRAAAAWDGNAEGEARAPARDRAGRRARARVAMRCGDDCVQLHGGSGFIRDSSSRSYMRDAKQLAALLPDGGAARSARQRRSSSARRSTPALVLPTPRHRKHAFT